MNVYRFSKMHGAGNDFVMLNGVTQDIKLNVEQRRHIANRHCGIGCDQILLLLPPQNSDTDFYCQIFNADGSESGQCGNGMRCLGAFIQQESLGHQKTWSIETIAGVMRVTPVKAGMRASLCKAQFDPKLIPFNAHGAAPYTVHCLDQEFSVEIAYLGNGHALIEVPDPATAPVDIWGEALSTHQSFPESVNVSFVRYRDKDNVDLRIYERGVGETLACGSAAAASVAVGHKLGKTGSSATVHMPGGNLTVSHNDQDQSMQIEGPVHMVFRGNIELPS